MTPSTLHSFTVDSTRTFSGRNAKLTEAALVGSKAHDIMSSSFTGRVIASGSKALYIRGEQGQIIGVARASQPAHTRFLLARMEPSKITTGSKVWSDGTRLSFDGDTTIKLSNTQVWYGRSPHNYKAIPVTHLDAMAAYRKAMALHSGQNLGMSLKMIHGQGNLGGLLDSAQGYESAFLRAGADVIKKLTQPDPSASSGLDIEAGKSLVGLGPGLTPSGDDFLGGMFFALWHLNAAYPSEFNYDTEHIDSLLDFAASQTNQISYAILTDFADGQGPAPLHDLMEALLTGKPMLAISDCIRRVAAIGHSSGWDMLAGFMVGMTMINEMAVA
ncbi:MAG: DUF2877 domain-containing protein [SAR202 cluster bacterium]|nr:DUF2877 domain-containing protein [SAR202 cluster bacterium]MDP6512660.1 DUF2877 domain-containing protein [SAR202 cluster bacterium]MDP6715828.1 DUF2877 domain-containing protein [SAR202 cluster bacterium]